MLSLKSRPFASQAQLLGGGSAGGLRKGVPPSPNPLLRWWATQGSAPRWKKHGTICGKKKKNRDLLPALFSIMRVRVNTDGGNEESGLRLNTQLIVAPAIANGTTCSPRSILGSLFLNPLQEIRSLGPASFSLLSGPRVTVQGFLFFFFFPREIR